MYIFVKGSNLGHTKQVSADNSVWHELWNDATITVYDYDTVFSVVQIILCYIIFFCMYVTI